MFTLKPSDLSCWTVTKKVSWKKKKECEENQLLLSINAFTSIYWDVACEQQPHFRSSLLSLFFEGREVTTGNAFAVRRLTEMWKTFNWYWPFVVFGSNSEDNGWLGREVDMRALKSGRADSAGGLGTTIHTYKSELDWARAWWRQPCYWFVVWLVVWLAAYGEVHGVFTYITSGIGRCFPR